MWAKQRWPARVWDVRSQLSPEAGPPVGLGEGNQDVYTAMIGRLRCLAALDRSGAFFLVDLSGLLTEATRRLAKDCVSLPLVAGPSALPCLLGDLTASDAGRVEPRADRDRDAGDPWDPPDSRTQLPQSDRCDVRTGFLRRLYLLRGRTVLLACRRCHVQQPFGDLSVRVGGFGGRCLRGALRRGIRASGRGALCGFGAVRHHVFLPFAWRRFSAHGAWPLPSRDGGLRRSKSVACSVTSASKRLRAPTMASRISSVSPCRVPPCARRGSPGHGRRGGRRGRRTAPRTARRGSPGPSPGRQAVRRPR